MWGAPVHVPSARGRPSQRALSHPGTAPRRRPTARLPWLADPEATRPGPMTLAPSPLPLSVTTGIETVGAWTREVGRLLGRDEPAVAFGALRAVLHALRRQLEAERAADFSDALPTLLRGVFHEPLDGVGYTGNRAGFLACVDRTTRHAVQPEEAVRAVCTVLAAHLPSDAWPGVRDGLPAEIARLLDVPPHPVRPRRPSTP